jgi:hypothetical protein
VFGAPLKAAIRVNNISIEKPLECFSKFSKQAVEASNFDMSFLSVVEPLKQNLPSFALLRGALDSGRIIRRPDEA